MGSSGGVGQLMATVEFRRLGNGKAAGAGNRVVPVPQIMEWNALRHAGVNLERDLPGEHLVR